MAPDDEDPPAMIPPEDEECIGPEDIWPPEDEGLMAPEDEDPPAMIPPDEDELACIAP